ncbi:uncharacterized protein LOC110919046 [Helianthus annuus]|uniref:uncharacterized protein LOC110919046 n=1 Tax=Helianthus annuus TaxID=4232 RepID=UPI000B8FFFAD|nr:uncharacterized protein LOC110919046 [Helianthus annuus]
MEETHEHKLIKDELKNVAAMRKELKGSANNRQEILVSIDHLVIDDVRMGYNKLCLYKKEFLHLEDVYDKLVLGMICLLTVEIASKIKKCKLTTTKEEFDKWDKYLKAFESFSMKVWFLHDKLITLETLVLDSEGALDITKFVEETHEHKLIKDELKNVAAMRKELKGSANNRQEISEIIKQTVERHELRF